MQFQKAQANENFFERWVSENNVWEIGFTQIMSGVRVRLGRIGSPCVNVDYCAGDNPGFALHLLVTIVKILEPIPESISGAEIEAMFPNYEIKPINKDPHCWKRLQEMAKTK